MQSFLNFNQLKISKDYLLNVRNEEYAEIVSVFENKSNLNRAYSIVKEYANFHGVHPDHEGKVLDEIKSAIQNKRKTIKFSLIQSTKRLFIAFSYLWGKEEISPEAKSILAIVFTVTACILGSIWTSKALELGILKYVGFGIWGNSVGGFIEGLFGSRNDFVHLSARESQVLICLT